MGSGVSWAKELAVVGEANPLPLAGSRNPRSSGQ